MDQLNKTIKKLSDREYIQLLEAVTGNRKDKPYQVLESARTANLNDAQMCELLGVNNSTYYTLKSRLNSKIASFLSKSVENPISALKEKVSQVQANYYGTNRGVSIKALEDLEKELIEYDLSNELLLVYKTLARLHLYNGDYNHYQRLYDRHVAYSLAVTKAEDLFYEFNRKFSAWLFTRDLGEMDTLRLMRREMKNLYELHKSHRMYVLNKLTRIYMLTKDPAKEAEAASMEVEVDSDLQEIKRIFSKFPMDTFYQNIKPIADFAYFEYYTKTGNMVRADFHYKKVNEMVPDLCRKNFLSFYLIQFLDAKVRKFLTERNPEKLDDLNEVLLNNFEIDGHEVYHKAVLLRFFAIGKFYRGDYAGAAKIMNDVRNQFSFRNYPYFEIECKLFHALQYCMLGDEELCSQILVSVARQVPDDKEDFEAVRHFMKVMKNAMKTTDFRQKIKKVTESWEMFLTSPKGNFDWLWFVRLDEHAIRRLSNPMK